MAVNSHFYLSKEKRVPMVIGKVRTELTTIVHESFFGELNHLKFFGN